VSEIALDDSLTLANRPPDSITVVVAAKGKQLLRQTWRDYGVRILATAYGPGRHVVPLSAANTTLIAGGNRVAIDGVVSPTSINLHVDEIVRATVDVVLDLDIKTDEGFAVSRISDPLPPQVVVRGAELVVDRLSAVSTIPRQITGVRNNLSLLLPLRRPEGYRIGLDPDSVLVEVEVLAIKTRVFENIPVVVYNVPADRQVSIQPRVINVELTGPPEDIDLLNPNALVASVDYRRRDSLNAAPIKVDAPSNFRVKKTSAESVQFTTRRPQ
nr:hypothetical protein [candidate division Zixibacteria bacterium]